MFPGALSCQASSLFPALLSLTPFLAARRYTKDEEYIREHIMGTLAMAPLPVLYLSEALRRSFTPCCALACVVQSTSLTSAFLHRAQRKEGKVCLPPYYLSPLFACSSPPSSYLLPRLSFLPASSPSLTSRHHQFSLPFPSLPPCCSPPRFPSFSCDPPILPPYFPRSSVHSYRPFRPSSCLTSSLHPSRPSSLPLRAY